MKIIVDLSVADIRAVIRERNDAMSGKCFDAFGSFPRCRAAGIRSALLLGSAIDKARNNKARERYNHGHPIQSDTN